jgi:hypothetical protein
MCTWNNRNKDELNYVKIQEEKSPIFKNLPTLT